MQKHDKAIVTLALGEKYMRLMQDLVLANWQVYADRHGYDIIVLDEPLDTSERAQGRSPAWQKLLILSHPKVRDYRRVLWLDVDILINPNAPDLDPLVAPDKIGAVDEWSTPCPDQARQGMQRADDYWTAVGVPHLAARSPGEWHAAWGLPDDVEHVVQTGVLALTPALHADILERIYREYDDKGGSQFNYEMRPCSYVLQKAGLVQFIDPRFNILYIYYKLLFYPFLMREPAPPSIADRIRAKFTGVALADRVHPLAETCAQTALLNAHFLHFCGGPSEMRVLQKGPASLRQIIDAPTA